MFFLKQLKIIQGVIPLCYFKIFLNLENVFLWVEPRVLESSLQVSISICPMDFDISFSVLINHQGHARNAETFCVIFPETTVKSRSTGNFLLKELKRKRHAYPSKEKLSLSQGFSSLCTMDSLTIGGVTMWSAASSHDRLSHTNY